MTKKPSERIIEIARGKLEEHKQGCSEHGFLCHINEYQFLSSAIMDFLDEEANRANEVNRIMGKTLEEANRIVNNKEIIME